MSFLFNVSISILRLIPIVLIHDLTL